MKNIFHFAACCFLAVVLIIHSLNAQWQQCSGTNSWGSINSITSIGGIAYAGTTTGGILRSTDAGANWQQLNNGLANTTVNTVFMVNSYFSNPNNYVLAGTNGGVFFSTDSGKTWSAKNDGFGVSSTVINSIYGYGDYLFGAANSGGMYSANKKDVVWQWKSISGSTVSSFGFCGRESGGVGSKIFAGTTTNGMIVSSDSGKSWTTSGLAGKSINAVNGITRTTIIAGAGDGFYSSLDTGKTWTNNNKGFASAPIVSSFIVNNPYLLMGTKGNGVFILAGTIGASISFDGTWSSFNTGMNVSNIYTMATDGKYVYAGTSDGVWRRPMSDVVLAVQEQSVAQPNEFSLQQNFPNPFNPTTTIEFSISHVSFVKINIYNSLGQEIESLVSEELQAGSYKTDWKPSNLASGIYYYRVQANEFMQIKSMILMK